MKMKNKYLSLIETYNGRNIEVISLAAFIMRSKYLRTPLNIRNKGKTVDRENVA